MLTVRIGRTLQSFPPSKRRGPLSTHAAFQHDGLRPLAWAGTLPKPWARLALSGSPLSTSPRCGFAQSVRDTTPGRPAPCPRHDRPAFGGYAAAVLLPHTGLFVSDDVGEALGEFPSARTTDRQQPVAASSTPGARGDNAAQRSDLRSPAPAHVGSGVSQPLAPRRHHDASDSGASRQQRSQDSSGLPRVAHRSRPVMNRLQTPGVANP